MAAYEGKRDVDRYCDTVYRELSDLKKKAFVLICKLEATTVQEEARKAEYFDLFELMDDIEERLGALIAACPAERGVARAEIESGRKKLEDAINWWFD